MKLPAGTLDQNDVVSINYADKFPQEALIEICVPAKYLDFSEQDFPERK